MRESFNRLLVNGALLPSLDRSLRHKTIVINQYRVGHTLNAAGVNVKIFPSTSASHTSSTGLPVDRICPTYTVMPFQSNCAANFTDG